MQGADIAVTPDLESVAKGARMETELAAIRRRHLEVARQNVYRLEMAYIRDQRAYRRTRFLSLSLYILGMCSAASTAMVAVQPQMSVHWRAAVAAHALLAALLAVVGMRRDARFAENSWTRLRFRAPRRTA